MISLITPTTAATALIESQISALGDDLDLEDSDLDKKMRFLRERNLAQLEESAKATEDPANKTKTIWGFKTPPKLSVDADAASEVAIVGVVAGTGEGCKAPRDGDGPDGRHERKQAGNDSYSDKAKARPKAKPATNICRHPANSIIPVLYTLTFII